jgi:hypothetical protein
VVVVKDVSLSVVASSYLELLKSLVVRYEEVFTFDLEDVVVFGSGIHFLDLDSFFSSVQTACAGTAVA